MISKNKAIDVMDLCVMRRVNDLNCMNCIYHGRDCIEAHNYAGMATRVILQRDVKKEAMNDSDRGRMESNKEKHTNQ